MVALIKKVLDVKNFWTVYKKSKLEGIVWLLTFLAVMVFDVDIGLYTGLVSNLFLVIVKSQRALSSLLGNIPGTHIFESMDMCKEAREYKHIKIIRYEESVYYTNVDNFKYKVIKLSGINPELVLRKIDKECHKLYKKLENDASYQKKLFKKDKPFDLPNSADYVLEKVNQII